jgi:hypothetical protein
VPLANQSSTIVPSAPRGSADSVAQAWGGAADDAAAVERQRARPKRDRQERATYVEALHALLLHMQRHRGSGALQAASFSHSQPLQVRTCECWQATSACAAAFGCVKTHMLPCSEHWPLLHGCK